MRVIIRFMVSCVGNSASLGVVTAVAILRLFLVQSSQVHGIMDVDECECAALVMAKELIDGIISVIVIVVVEVKLKKPTRARFGFTCFRSRRDVLRRASDAASLL